MRFAKLFQSVNVFGHGVNSGRIVGRYCSAFTECGEQGQDKEKQESSGDGNKGSVVLGVYESCGKLQLSPAAQEVDQRSGGKLTKHLNQMEGKLKLGKAQVVTDVAEYGAAALAALGPPEPGYNTLEHLDETRENVRVMVGAGVRALMERGVAHIAVDGAAAVDAAAEAAELAAWRFEEFKTSEIRSPTPQLSLCGGADAAWERGAVLGRAQNWARFLSDMPANKMTPVDLAQAALDVLCPLGVRVTAFERRWIEAQRMEAFLAVARGSCEAPLFLQCEYTPAPAAAPVLLAAKGITFDSGGMCLKSPELMREARGSMAGAAVALATLRALAELKVAINVCCVIPLCENMVSGQCMKVGDVVRALNGLSLQIEDTDMEGRLALADALVYGQMQYKPSLVIDVATLTRGVLLATGGGAFGCFSNCERAWAAMRDAGAATGDRPWRFPLWSYYQRQIDNDPAVDLRNKGSGTATSCIGAAFLKNFICGDWIHVDMTGVGRVTPGAGPCAPYLTPHRMSGRPTRTLVALLTAAAASGDPAPAPRDPPPAPRDPPPATDPLHAISQGIH